MLVKIEEIKETGLDLHEPFTAAFVDEAIAGVALATGAKAAHALTLQAHFSKVSGGVLLKGTFQLDLVAPCKRCLADVAVTVPVSFMLNLVPETQLRPKKDREAEAADESGGSFDLEAVDAELFNGKTIDLDPIVREQVLLALPLSVVCRDDCKGLCAVCGQNLNDDECGCERKVLDPRLMALKDIKLN